ncbi:MAG TPA: U32 family peptidase [Clostridiales bacterium]|nr:U32 family peptidase [Clostridiales bacterium]
MHNKSNIEILSPAGTLESMRAAINAGCDAVYLGGSAFGARAYANNFTDELLLEAIDEAHIKDVKLYLTVNTLIKEKEMKEQLYEFLYKFYQQGLDAVIVQDLGAINFINKHFPKLPIHLSTQATTMMAEGINLLEGFGISRMVTPRELSLEEIKKIKEKSNVEIETFVHGALCYSYSGQCLMSSMIGGRSGNRGRCAQPCRMEYKLYNNGQVLSSDVNKYILSPKDICAVEFIPEMIDAGIDSFKIEGRMKSSAYAATVTSFYRKYIDLYFSEGKTNYKSIVNIKNKEYSDDIMLLQDIYNRGNFTAGYLQNYSGKTMMSMARPNHKGVLVGTITDVNPKLIKVLLTKDINGQDILEIRGKNISYEFTVKDSISSGNIFSTRYLKNKGNDRYKIGDKVYRTRNKQLINNIKNKYIEEDNKIEVHAILTAKIGLPLKLKLISELHHLEIEVEMNNVEKAFKRPITKDDIIKQINKTGESYFSFKKIDLELYDSAFIPLTNLNQIRREAIELLKDTIIKKYQRNSEEKYKEDIIRVSKELEIKNYGIAASVQMVGQLEYLITKEDVKYIYIDLDFLEIDEIYNIINELKTNKKFYYALPRICRESTYNYLLKHKHLLLDNNIDGYIIRNIEEVNLIKEINSKKECILDYNMYIYNKEAKLLWNSLGVSRFTAPVELNYGELRQLTINDCDLIVYGNIPVMVSTQCVYKNTVGCIKAREDSGKTGVLLDKMDMKFPVKINCRDCYNIIYNSKVLSLINHNNDIDKLKPHRIRMDFTIENNNEIENVIDQYINKFKHKKDIISRIDDYTSGHFKRGIL